MPSWEREDIQAWLFIFQLLLSWCPWDEISRPLWQLFPLCYTSKGKLRPSLAKEAAFIVERWLNLGFKPWLTWMAPFNQMDERSQKMFLGVFFGVFVFCNQWEERCQVSGQTAAALHLIRKCPTRGKKIWVNRKL